MNIDLSFINEREQQQLLKKNVEQRRCAGQCIGQPIVETRSFSSLTIVGARSTALIKNGRMYQERTIQTFIAKLKTSFVNTSFRLL